MNSTFPISYLTSCDNRNSFLINVKKAFWVLEIPFDPILGIFTQSIAEILCLETLKHGTSFENYLNIRLEGADPSHGGKRGGSSSLAERYSSSSKGYFYVFKDSGIIKIESIFMKKMPVSELDLFMVNLHKREISELSNWDLLDTTHIKIPLYARFHALLSAWNAQDFSSSDRCKLFVNATHLIASFFTPTLNFRFIPEELDLKRYENVKSLSNQELSMHRGRFLEDECFSGMAWKTKRKIGLEHIGAQSLLCQGFKGNLLGRIKQNPHKCVYGLIRLVALLVLFGYALTSFNNSVDR